MATLGVIAVVYGGAKTSTHEGPLWDTSVFVSKPTAPLFGNLLTLVASFGYALYQVLYKIHAALPSDSKVASDHFYREVSSEDDSLNPDNPENIQQDAVHPLPFGFHPNLLTSIMGLFTFTLLWIPIPFLHYSGAEIFRLPPNFFTVIVIAGIAASGVVFNASFMASYWLLILLHLILMMDDIIYRFC